MGTLIRKPSQSLVNAHIAEIGQILARSLIRLRARQSSPKCVNRGESSLDFLPDQSGGANIPFGDRRRE